LAVGPGSKRVFVAGIRDGGADQHDYVTIAYRTSDGSAAWTRIYDGPATGTDEPGRLALSPDGTKVFVTGRSRAATHDYATVAYRAGSGRRLWVRRYDGPAPIDLARDVVATGRAVFVTGESEGTSTGNDVATIAYAADSGQRLWDAHYQGPAGSTDFAIDVAVDPLGARVFVMGTTWSGATSATSDMETIAYVA
jgi:DNA-binding beta-propeller fold protein YncE